jgi:biotin-(acetyl-CoA carboxylase) ligase
VYPKACASFPATIRDVTSDGELVVEESQGSRHTFTSVDVSIRPAATNPPQTD